MNDVEKLIQIAEAEVGYLEKKSNAQLDSKTANAGMNNFTKYGKAQGCNGQAWCDAFVDWCFTQAYGKDEAKKLLGGFSNYTPTSAQYFKNIGAWYKSNPKRGDVIFFKNSQRICHTGIVYKVANGVVYTIEGNTSAGTAVIPNGGGVCKKQYSTTNSRIAGYGRPKYDTTSTPVKTISIKKTIPPLANPTVKSGSKGAEALNLQKDLNYVMNAKLVEDGDFGAKSKAALIAFQTRYKLTADGIYGAKSKAKMKELLK